MWFRRLNIEIQKNNFWSKHNQLCITAILQCTTFCQENDEYRHTFPCATLAQINLQCHVVFIETADVFHFQIHFVSTAG